MQEIVDVSAYENHKFERLTVLGYCCVADEYRKRKILVQCECGIVKSISIYDFIRNKIKSCGCVHIDRLKSLTGSNNPMYGKVGVWNGKYGKDSPIFGRKRNPEHIRYGKDTPGWKGGISSESQLARTNKEFKDWRTNVFERDNYTCQVCGQWGGKLEAHHLQNFAQYLKSRTDVNNGITLCYNCHRSFHKVYSNNNNNTEQFFLWMSKELKIDTTNNAMV